MQGHPVESMQLLEYTCFAACKQQLCTARGGKDQAWSEPAEQSYKPELTAPWPLTEKAASPRGGEKAIKERESRVGNRRQRDLCDWAPDKENIEEKNLGLFVNTPNPKPLECLCTHSTHTNLKYRFVLSTELK